MLCDTFDTSISIMSTNVSFTSIEEVSIYRSATIPQNIMTIPVSIWCSLQLNRFIVDNYCIVRDSNEKARHIKACQTHSKHVF